MENNKIQKLNDDILEDVNGGAVNPRNALYRPTIDSANAGYAVMGNDITGDPMFLEGQGKGTNTTATGLGNNGQAANKKAARVNNMPTWT